jgi:hypothetical protein
MCSAVLLNEDGDARAWGLEKFDWWRGLRISAAAYSGFVAGRVHGGCGGSVASRADMYGLRGILW